MDSSHSPTTKPLYRATQIVWYLLGLIEVFLLFRFLFKLFVANPEATFTSFIYNTTEVLILPFTTVFRTNTVDESMFEWTTLLAMVVYALIAWGVIKLFLMGKTVSTPEAAVQLNKQENS